jgi:hypothetical protein
MSNIHAFNQVMRLAEQAENSELGELIIMLEAEAPARPLIDDAIGISGNHKSPVAKALLHLDFLYEDISKYPTMEPELFGKYIDSQYGCLRANLIAALKPDGVINYEAVAAFDKRHYITSPNPNTGGVTIRVNSSLIRI